MKKLLVLLAGPAYLLVLVGFTCTNHHYGTETGKAYFWKKSDPAATHYLYVDNSLKGVLPYIPESSTAPGSSTVQQQGLYMDLAPGKYAIEARDKSGAVLCKGSLLLKRTQSQKEIKTSWNNGRCGVEMVYGE